MFRTSLFVTVLGLFSIIPSLGLAVAVSKDGVVSRSLAIPYPPTDPPAPASGDGAGPYDSQDPSISDRLTEAKFYAIAITAGELNMVNAERNMRHYLGNSGDDLYENVEEMMRDMPEFREFAQSVVQNAATVALHSVGGTSGEKTFSSKWSSFYATTDISIDWYFGLGGFSVSATGVVIKATAGNSLRYKIHIFDRYNWDAGKNVRIPGIGVIEDTELAKLHLVGLAREYLVRGSSAENNVKDFKEGTVPLPDIGGRG